MQQISVVEKSNKAVFSRNLITQLRQMLHTATINNMDVYI